MKLKVGQLCLSRILIVMFFCFGINLAHANSPPKLNFIDIISGPDTGLGDSLGSGAIVTLWGNNLGSTQNGAAVKFRAFDGSITDVAHIYYWKNADGQLPGGPANLYKSHKMQEVAVSIPDTTAGLGELFVAIDGVESNALPFTVRAGTIKWVAPEGNNNNACTFIDPCGWINGDINGSTNGLGNQKLNQGDIVYSRGVIEPEYCGGGACAGMFLRAIVGTQQQPISLIAYPGTLPRVISKNRGINMYLSDYVNVSKFYISVGSKDPDTPPDAGNPFASDFHIQATKGRYVGNLLDEKLNTCFNGWSGSITSSGNGGSDAKIFGNHFYALGCDNASRYQHTLYMSVRSANATNVKAWEIGWNYLEDNESFYGIHNYDETYNGDCGNVVGTLKIHNNYIVNQKGAGIHVSTNDASGVKNVCWETDISIYNNVLINVGLGPAAEDNVVNAGAIKIGGDLGSDFIEIYNNTIYGYSDASSRANSNPVALSVNTNLDFGSPVLSIENNFIYALGDYDYLETNLTISVFNNNLFYTTSANPNNALMPNIGANNLSSNPQCVLSGQYIDCLGTSPLVDSGLNRTPHDIYGINRGTISDIGAIEYSVRFLDSVFSNGFEN